ncbi:hypothetical protein ACFL6I_26805, partial [candidate division KSB1 bacterium]
MSKTTLITLGIATLLILGVGVFVYSKSHNSLKQTLSTNSGDLLLKNREKADLKIFTADIDEISISLVGPAD